MPASATDPFVAGLVLGAGGSRRLGRPKQLLPYRGGTLLGHAVVVARACPFDQLVVAVGGAAEEVRARVDLAGADVVVNDAYGSGCSSSIAAALAALDPRCDLLVLMLGDQPGVTAATVESLLAGRRGAPLAACRYDGRARPPDRLRPRGLPRPRGAPRGQGRLAAAGAARGRGGRGAGRGPDPPGR